MNQENVEASVLTKKKKKAVKLRMTASSHRTSFNGPGLFKDLQMTSSVQAQSRTNWITGKMKCLALLNQDADHKIPSSPCLL